MKPSSVALITGAARGLGQAMAMSFAKKGYAIGLHYHSSESKAQDTKAEIERLGVPCLLLKADVRQSAQVADMMKKLNSEWGRLDVLINNSGLAQDQRIEKMTDDDWNNVLQTNLNGTFYCTREAISLMKDNKKGSILNVTSFLARKPAVGASNYAAAKAAVSSFTQSSALELSRYNIRVNAIMPGFHVTDMNEKVWKKFEPVIRKQHLLDQLPDRNQLGEFVYTIATLETVTGQIFPFESRLLS